jgi:hypothetical protein
VKSSDTLLRRFSKASGAEPADLIKADAPYEELAALAGPIELAVIDGLSAQLELTAGGRAAAARELADKLQKERAQLEKQKQKRSEKCDKDRRRIRESLSMRWPELHNRWDPKVCELLERQPSSLIRTVEQHPDYSDFESESEEIGKITDERFDLERKWVKCQRLLRTLENVALAANLPKLATAEVQEAYQRLLMAEAGTLGRQP